jgi:hypothetical protein
MNGYAQTASPQYLIVCILGQMLTSSRLLSEENRKRTMLPTPSGLQHGILCRTLQRDQMFHPRLPFGSNIHVTHVRESHLPGTQLLPSNIHGGPWYTKVLSPSAMCCARMCDVCQRGLQQDTSDILCQPCTVHDERGMWCHHSSELGTLWWS